jgi:hypothetical protein
MDGVRGSSRDTPSSHRMKYRRNKWDYEMKTTLVLESILLFLINLHTVRVSLAAYTKLSIPSLVDYEIATKMVSKLPVSMVSVEEPNLICSEVMLVVIDNNTKQIQHRKFSDKEINLLMALREKIGETEFDKFITTCFFVDKTAFIEIVNNRLRGGDLIASNESKL